MPSEFLSVDASEIKALGAALRKQNRPVYLAVQRALRVAGQVIAEDARGKASWSSRIPGTIRVGADGIQGIKLMAGGGKNSAAPHAKPYEHAGKSGTFRHPVFADASETRDQWTWATEQARPFLHPAAMEHLQESAELVAETVAKTLQAFLDA